MTSVIFSRRGKDPSLKPIGARHEELNELLKEVSDLSDSDSDETGETERVTIKHSNDDVMIRSSDIVKDSVIRRWERRGRSPPFYVYFPWGVIRSLLFHLLFISWFFLLFYIILEATAWQKSCNKLDKDRDWLFKRPILKIEASPKQMLHLWPSLLVNISNWDIRTFYFISPDWLESFSDEESAKIFHRQGQFVILDVSFHHRTSSGDEEDSFCQVEGSHKFNLSLTADSANFIVNYSHENMTGFYINKPPCMDDGTLTNWTQDLQESWRETNSSNDLVLLGDVSTAIAVSVTLSTDSVESALTLLSNFTNHMKRLEDKGASPIWDVDRSGFIRMNSSQVLQRLLILEMFFPGTSIILPEDLISSSKDVDRKSISWMSTALHLKISSSALQENKMNFVNKKIPYIESNVFALVRVGRKDRYLICWNMGMSEITIDFSYISRSGTWVFSTDEQRVLQTEVSLKSLTIYPDELGLLQLPSS